jgi:hypothetical protein
MYTGQDLVDVQNSLDALCADGFFTYYFSIGVNPYLDIIVSNAQVVLYPWLEITPYNGLLSVYNTADFNMTSAEFIDAFTVASQSWATTNLPVFEDYNTHLSTFSDFVAAVDSKQ